ncbi:MAG: hypothetical protein R6U22_09195, partial [Desulfohalobiaceae bacterium]
YRILILDHKGNLQGTDLDGDGEKFAGYLTDEFAVENLTKPTERTTSRQTPVFFKLADSQEYRDNFAAFADMHFVGKINGLLDATIEVLEYSTDDVTVQVNVKATEKGVSGLHPDAGDDFVITDDALESGPADTFQDPGRKPQRPAARAAG